MTNRKLVKDKAAEVDLIGIWLYTFETWSESHADGYMRELEKGIMKIAADPTIGVPRTNLREDYWSKKVEHYIVFYTFTAGEVRIRRVLHEIMDVYRHL